MISIESKSLRRMFEQVTPHMDDDEDYLPVISTVRLEARDGWLYAVATDRYTIGVSRREAVTDGNLTGHVPGPLVPAVAAWLDSAAGNSENVSLSLPADDHPAPIILTAPGRGELVIDYDADDYEKFPNWRKILHEALTAEPSIVPLTGYTTKLLTRWQHAASKLVAWQEAPGKPLVLLDELGYFAGLHMPVNFHRQGLTRDDVAKAWIAATTHYATVDGLDYDLSKTWADKHGDPWTYSGKDCPDGTPLMVIEGIEDDPHPLDRLIGQYGPIYVA